MKDEATLHDMVIKKSAKSMIQTKFDDATDLSFMTDKDAVKAARRAERDERKAKAAAELSAARVHDALCGDKPVLARNTYSPPSCPSSCSYAYGCMPLMAAVSMS
jgi:hypothetical protein